MKSTIDKHHNNSDTPMLLSNEILRRQNRPIHQQNTGVTRQLLTPKKPFCTFGYNEQKNKNMDTSFLLDF